MTKHKHVVCLSDGGRVENIIDASGLEDLWLEYRLLTDDTTKTEERFDPIKNFIDSMNSMELRNRYNSQRNPKVYVWDCELTYGELWDKLELDGDYHHLVKTTAKPYYN